MPEYWTKFLLATEYWAGIRMAFDYPTGIPGQMLNCLKFGNPLFFPNEEKRLTNLGHACCSASCFFFCMLCCMGIWEGTSESRVKYVVEYVYVLGSFY